MIGSIRTSRSRRARLACLAATAAAVTAVQVVGTSSARADAPVTISGEVTCLNSFAADGVWIEAANGGSGFAEVRGPSPTTGWGVSSFDYTLPHGGAWTAHVGCGGDSRTWGDTYVAQPTTSSSPVLLCNDVPFYLQWVVEWRVKFLRYAIAAAELPAAGTCSTE